MAATHHRHGSRTLPRRPSAHADSTTPAGEDGLFGRLLPHPPTAFPLWQEGRLQQETFEACSEFMFFSACAFAPRLRRGLLRRLQPDDCSSSAAPVATGRTDNSPDGTCTRWPSRPRRSLCNLVLSSHQASFRVALPVTSSAGAFFRVPWLEPRGLRGLHGRGGGKSGLDFDGREQVSPARRNLYTEALFSPGGRTP